MERNVQNLFKVEKPGGEVAYVLAIEMHDELGFLTPLEVFIQTWDV